MFVLDEIQFCFLAVLSTETDKTLSHPIGLFLRLYWQTFETVGCMTKLGKAQHL